MFGDASMVLSLEHIRNIEDKNLLAGHTMVLLDRDTAQAQVLVKVAFMLSYIRFIYIFISVFRSFSFAAAFPRQPWKCARI